MFDLEHDRYSYGYLLLPKAGFTLDAAAGTTYSLDLEALLGVPVSLGLLEEADGELMRSPLYLLEAIRKSADKFAVFCNAGCISLPQNIESVYALLDQSVFQVKLENKCNFHPKLWVLKYSDGEGNSYIKLVVLSRNLTFDHSIDVCAALTGTVKKAKRLKNKPVADMLLYLMPYASEKKQKLLRELADAVLHVPAFEVGLPFKDYEFLPMGIPGHTNSAGKLLEKKRDIFAVSPFLSDSVVKQIADCTGHKVLITRKASVTRAVMEAFDHVYVTREILSDNEFLADQDIHAKLYFVHTDDGNSLYLGSANASRNAFYKNVECLLRLDYAKNRAGWKSFADAFLQKGCCPYEEVTVLPELPPEEPEQESLREALQEAVTAVGSASAFRDGDTWTILVSSAPMDTRVRIAPLYRTGCSAVLTESSRFSGLLLKELSEFFVLSIEDQCVVIKIPTAGIPRERDQAIYRSVIDTREKFMSYLSFALSDDYQTDAAEHELLVSSDRRREDSRHDTHTEPYPAVYEKLLKAFHAAPRKLLGIRDMVSRLDPEVVSPEFIQMFRQFEELTERRRHQK